MFLIKVTKHFFKCSTIFKKCFIRNLIINPIKENNHLPINPEEHYWKASLFLLPISMTTFLSLLIFFTFPPEEIITKNK